MIKALLYQQLPSQKVQCTLCPHSCRISNGKLGLCKIRKNIDGILYALNYGKIVAARPDPVEKKPLFHFLPGHSSYSISSVGCNLTCRNCQNSSISQQAIHEIHIHDTTPQEIIQATLASDCQSIAYTYTEPTTLLEFIVDTARLSAQHNIHNILVSNGYMSDPCIDTLIPLIQAINIDLKSFTDSFYQNICHAHLAPILNSIKRFHQAGVHVEITTLLIPGLNDNDEELKQLSAFIHAVHPEIPWHISRFHPSYKMPDIPATPLETLLKAQKIGKEQGLHHIYIGNVPEIESHTFCHHCHAILFKRSGFSAVTTNFNDGHCTQCGTKLFGIFT